MTLIFALLVACQLALFIAVSADESQQDALSEEDWLYLPHTAPFTADFAAANLDRFYRGEKNESTPNTLPVCTRSHIVSMSDSTDVIGFNLTITAAGDVNAEPFVDPRWLDDSNEEWIDQQLALI